jgi:hypothetical protein
MWICNNLKYSSFIEHSERGEYNNISEIMMNLINSE